jgi:hypothetical protein
MDMNLQPTRKVIRTNVWLIETEYRRRLPFDSAAVLLFDFIDCLLTKSENQVCLKGMNYDGSYTVAESR